jgi:predicted lipoprotein with Yx(FWY)xxD motif
MRFLSCVSSALVLVSGLAAHAAAEPREAYVKVAVPPGFHVETTELDGAVFTDARGHTLYTWPFRALRNGVTGDPEGKSTCENQKVTLEGGFMSPYPPGLILPDVETRPTCTEMWPPVFADADAKPVGDWSVITRKDGAKQWAYDEHALYTSALDKAPGDVMGATTRRKKGETAVLRYPAGPPPDVPPGLDVASTVVGRMIVNAKGAAVYSFDKDSATKSLCDEVCARVWVPVLAPEFAKTGGEWSTVERSPGVRQWAYRKKPLYTNTTDTRPRSVEGGDIPGWHNVYTQRAPAPPVDFTVHDTAAGAVLADNRGMTVYVYNCGDDAVDQLACDHPGASQAYRFAVCSGGDPAKCLERFPPILAPKDAKSTSRAWSVIAIDPKTGHHAATGAPDALRVWAYRDRPVYTFIGDKDPGDYEADGLGEFHGDRHGFTAFWVRDDFYGRTD